MTRVRGIPTRFLGALLAFALVIGGGRVNAQTPAPRVSVFIDGQPAAFDVPPVIAAGRVLVPLRGVFERLGAIVTWDPSTQTVLAERADTSVALRVGDTRARINGQPMLMDVPALLVSGRTMVPLRFVSQALGSQVSWDASSATVQITSQAAVGVPPSQTYPAPPPPVASPPVALPPAPATTTVTGTVVFVNAGVYPGQLQVQVGNAVYAFKVVSTTAVSRVNVATNSGGSVALDAVRPGDQVQVTVDQSGTAEAVQASYREVSGRVVAMTDAGLVVLENGGTFRLNRSVQVDRNGTAVNASTLRPGDVVTIRVDPQTNEVWAVTIRQEAATLVGGLTSVNVTPSGRELRAGDVVEVVATGMPGGRATFSIGRLRTGVPMVESTAQRGTYYGSYTIQPGDTIQGADVTIRLTTPDGQVFTATAPTRVQINAAAERRPASPVQPQAQPILVIQSVQERIVSANLGARTARLANGRTFTVVPDVYISYNGRRADFGAVTAGRYGRFWVLAGTSQAIAVDLVDAPAGSAVLPATEILEGKIVDANLSARTARLANGRTLTVLRDVYVSYNGRRADFGAVTAGRYGRFWVLDGTSQAIAVDVADGADGSAEFRATGIVDGKIVDANLSARTARLADGRTLTVLRDVYVSYNGRRADFGAVTAGRYGRFWVLAGTSQAIAVDIADAAVASAELPATGIVDGKIVDASLSARTARLANGRTLTILPDIVITYNGRHADFGAVAAGRYGRFWIIAGTNQAFVVDLRDQ